MAQNPVARDLIALNQILSEIDQDRHLSRWKSPIAMFMAGIDQFDPDRTGIDIPFARQEGDVGMPGAPAFLDQGPDRAVCFDKVMRRGLTARVAKPIDSGHRAGHAGIMQHQHVNGTIHGSGSMVRRRQFDHYRNGPQSLYETDSPIARPRDRT